MLNANVVLKKIEDVSINRYSSEFFTLKSKRERAQAPKKRSLNYTSSIQWPYNVNYLIFLILNLSAVSYIQYTNT